MNKPGLFILLILFLLPLLTEAQVTQVNFITDPQTIYLNEISNTITIQLQDLVGNLSQTTETVDIEFLSSSPTGEFLSPTT
ncbi:hypothetical protein GW950_02345, partial [Candidatus Wolfebacteria bacterium]|nr:hypothetical protein [Candidatus Wolfebacteria bacterium]